MEKTYFIQFSGKAVSLNHYKSLSWIKLKKRIDPLKIFFNLKIREAKIPLLSSMRLQVEHNTNLDLDNVTGTVKPFVDCLRAQSVILDDNKKYFKLLVIKPNAELKKNTILFIVVGEVMYPTPPKKKGNKL